MRILITSPEQSSLTGQPMYCKNLAKGLRELGHEVICSEHPQGVYDLVIVNDFYPEVLGEFTAKKIYNLCHSKNPCDTPITDIRIDKYLVPRDEVLWHWKKWSIDTLDFEILPIPIDFNRWNIPKIPHKGHRIIAPCSFDSLRLPMLQDLCKRAVVGSVWLVGEDHGSLSKLGLNENVKVFPETDKLEDLMAQCDEVAGIYEGTVTHEAWAMGLRTSVYDEYGNWKYVDKPDDFDKHDYIKVAKKLIEIYGI